MNTSKITKMAEDDEVDVLGDFSLDNFLSKTDSSLTLVSQNADLLNCDYTIHPQWLLDKPSANPDNWYDSDAHAINQNENESMGHVSTENCITDESGWTEKEKNLLERGIEIFGKSNVRLSQFIGSRTASEVRYYLKNFYIDNHTTCRTYSDCVIEDNNLVSDILDDTQIPASIEEVIAAVSTAKPTVQLTSNRGRKKSCSFSSDQFEISINDIPSGQSLLKTNYYKPGSSPTKDYKVKKHLITSKSRQKSPSKKSVKFKFKTNLKMPMKRAAEQEVSHVKQKTVKFMNENKKKTEVTKVEITTGVGLSVPICEGEEIIKLKKVEDDSDVDVDIECEEDVVPDKKTQLPKIKMEEPNDNKEHKNEIKAEANTKTEIKESNNALHNKQFIDLSTLDDETVKQLMSMEVPTEEVVLQDNKISELEKVIHCEFFEGRNTKTPERYLKIRNHIINSWKNIKPTYLTKTSIRQGLRNCGDVNCMGRVHYYLEQTGVINFGCSQMSYVRPLYDMLQTNVPVKEKPPKDVNKLGARVNELGARPRNKKKFTNDGEGGCTLTHDEKGEVINTTIVNEEPAIKQRIYIKKPIIRLIYCRPFTGEKTQDYVVNMHLSALLKMDFHAHTNLAEVMGLVAGYWNPHTKILTITHYETCKNMASSATHCDMCPISQARAAEIIHNKGLDILGWFHSHPTFAPEPSQQDLETQQVVQQWIGVQKPCIGVILSPFSLNGALIASPYRCMIVDKKLNFEDQFVPYKFKVNVISDDFDVEDFLNEIRRVCCRNGDGSVDSRIDFNKPYFQDASMSYLDKFIYSVRMHLAKCGNFNKMTCDNIIQGLTDICSK